MDTTLTAGRRYRGKHIGKRKRRGRKKRKAVFLLLILLAGVFLWQMQDRVTLGSLDQLREGGTPESLIELAERNPETEGFVRNWEGHISDPDSIDVSGEVRQGVIPYFVQWDSRWGYEEYGDEFLAVTGCGPVCLSMVYCGLTGDASLDPYHMAKRAEQEGYYVYGCGSSWSMMTDLANELGIVSHGLAPNTEDLLSVLSQGCPVIAIMGPGDFTSSGHFIVLTGTDGCGNVYVHDPNSMERSGRTWSADTILSQAQGLWYYTY